MDRLDFIYGMTPEQKRLIVAYRATAEEEDAYVPASDLLKDIAIRQLGWTEELCEMEIGELAHVGPHGCYSAGSLGFYYRELLALCQSWRCRYPLFETEGMPIGDLHDDSPAGPEFVEVSLSRIAQVLMPRRKAPLLPISLLNGATTSGGALIPSHNLYELWIAQEQVRQNPNISLEELLTTMPGPDLPTGAVVGDPEAVRALYEKGRGQLTIRGSIEDEIEGPRTRVAVTSLPPGLLIGMVMEKISSLSRSGRLRLYNIHNMSQGREVRIVIDAPGSLSPRGLKEILYKEAGLERRIDFRILPVEENRLPQAQCALVSVLKQTHLQCSPAWERKDGEELTRVPTLKEVMEFGGYKSPLSDLVDPRRTKILTLS
jgi:hypothetical protein